MAILRLSESPFSNKRNMVRAVLFLYFLGVWWLSLLFYGNFGFLIGPDGILLIKKKKRMMGNFIDRIAVPSQN